MFRIYFAGAWQFAFLGSKKSDEHAMDNLAGNAELPVASRALPNCVALFIDNAN